MTFDRFWKKWKDTDTTDTGALEEVAYQAFLAGAKAEHEAERDDDSFLAGRSEGFELGTEAAAMVLRRKLKTTLNTSLAPLVLHSSLAEIEALELEAIDAG
jgi:hypothetical protein